jgi:quinol monooxygenase YgiN
MSNLHVIATLVSKDDKAAELRGLLLAAIHKFRQEEGCLAYSLLADTNIPGRFVTYEQWTDHAALDAHMSSDTMHAMKPLLADLLAAPMTQDFLAALLVL